MSAPSIETLDLAKKEAMNRAMDNLLQLFYENSLLLEDQVAKAVTEFGVKDLVEIALSDNFRTSFCLNPKRWASDKIKDNYRILLNLLNKNNDFETTDIAEDCLSKIFTSLFKFASPLDAVAMEFLLDNNKKEAAMFDKKWLPLLMKNMDMLQVFIKKDFQGKAGLLVGEDELRILRNEALCKSIALDDQDSIAKLKSLGANLAEIKETGFHFIEPNSSGIGFNEDKIALLICHGFPYQECYARNHKSFFQKGSAYGGEVALLDNKTISPRLIEFEKAILNIFDKSSSVIAKEEVIEAFKGVEFQVLEDGLKDCKEGESLEEAYESIIRNKVEKMRGEKQKAVASARSPLARRKTRPIASDPRAQSNIAFPSADELVTIYVPRRPDAPPRRPDEDSRNFTGAAGGAGGGPDMVASDSVFSVPVDVKHSLRSSNPVRDDEFSWDKPPVRSTSRRLGSIQLSSPQADRSK